MTQTKPFDAAAFEASARKELRRSPAMWAWESARLSLYVMGRVVFTPWCLVWPAVTVWLIWWIEDVGARGAIEIFAASPDRAYAWIYVIGALIHSLAIMGSDPYEWEIDRRVRARLLTRSARTRWIKRETLASPAAATCVAPKGWDRVEPDTAAV
jgi:hypothetical protein